MGRFYIRATEGENSIVGGSGTGAIDDLGGAVARQCQEPSADFDIESAEFYALKVASLN